MKKKILMTYVIFLLIGTFSTGIISLSFVKNIYMESLEDKLLTNSNLIIETLLLKNEKEIVYFNLAQKFSKKINARVTFIEDDGVVIADSHNNSIIFKNHMNKPEIRGAVNGNLSIVKRFSSGMNKEILYVANPPVKVGDKNIIVRLSASLEEINRLNNLFFKYIFLAVFFGIIIAFVLGYYHIHKMVKPIIDLKEASLAIACGNFDKKVEVNTKDEMGQLAHHFNKMAKKLKEMITEMKKLENLRKDFVANVSHELRTPLTSISGFVETLKTCKNMSENDEEKVLNIIEFETERLKRLINDILRLSQIENVNIKTKRELIHIKEIIENVKNILEPIIKDKNIDFKVDIKEKECNVLGNKDWFQQMMINLCDNALKYTKYGGEVKASGFYKEENVYISIKDTGVGISEEDQIRIFERFYRVDKGRSRKMGGTGLGLAIVKHIVRDFDGEIKVKSEIGKGSEFIIKLPAYEEKSKK